MTILEFAQEILALIGGGESASSIGRCRRTIRSVRKPDISRARQLLGWEPRIGRKEGLRRTLDYFQSKIAAAAANESEPRP